MIEKATPVQPDVPDALKPVLDAARARFSRLQGGALLIGVEEYKAFDATGKKDLPAGRNDVLAYWKVCRRLGFTHVRLLTSPALTEDDLVRAELELVPELSPGETADQVRARVQRWLAHKAPELAPEIKGETAEEVAEAVQRWVSSVQQEPGDLAVLLREATSLELKEGARWLAKRLATSVKLAWGDWQLQEEWMSLPGIMTYSGHGAQADGDLALCPTDTGPALESAVSFSELRRIFDDKDDLPGGKHPTDNLTVFLDCCFAGASDKAGKGERVATLTPTGSSLGKAPVAKTEIGSRVFCASARDEQSYQAMLGGHWHGAFTWALTVALEQWKIQAEGQFKRSTMSHTELLFRARMLLQALSFRQHPILVDELGNLPVFHHGAGDGAGVSAGPDADRPGGQMDPTGDNYGHYVFSQYIPHNQSWEKMAEVIVTRPDTTPRYGFAARMEYWRVSGNARSLRTDEYTTMRVTKEGCGWPQEERALPFKSTEASFSCTLTPTWSDWIVGECRANGADRLFEDSGFRANLSWDPTSRNWEGTLEWVMAPGASYVFERVGRSGAELTTKGSSQTPGSLSCVFTPAWGLVTISGPV